MSNTTEVPSVRGEMGPGATPRRETDNPSPGIPGHTEASSEAGALGRPAGAEGAAPGDTPPIVVAVVAGTAGTPEIVRALADARGIAIGLVAGASAGSDTFAIAESLGIPTDPTAASVWTVPGVRLVVDLSGDPEIGASLERARPPGVELLGPGAAHLVGDLVRARLQGVEQARLYEELKEAYDVIRVQEARLRGGTEALERSNEELERRLAEIFFTHEFFRALTSFSSVHDVASLIVDGANGILGAEVSAVYLFEEAAGCFRLLASQGRARSALVELVPRDTTILGRAVRDGMVVKADVGPLGDSACWLTDPASIASQAAVALRRGDGVVGVLLTASARRRALQPPELERLAAVADQASLALQNALLHEELERLSVTDRLTELYNHGYFQQRLEQELARAARFGHRLALVMLDIDDFKSFNDTYGHRRGDNVLRSVSGIIRGTMRDMDVAARYGGEEFVLILPETGREGARSVAERIRADVAAAEFARTPHDVSVSRTVSIGVAVYPDDGATNGALVDSADQAMYRAKRAGKDRVALASDASSRPSREVEPFDSRSRPSDAGHGESPPPAREQSLQSDAGQLKTRLGTPIGRVNPVEQAEGRAPWDSRRP